MDAEPIEELVVKVRADTGGFMAGVNDIQRTLDGPFAAGLDRAGSGLSRALGRALSDGKFGFDDLRRRAQRHLRQHQLLCSQIRFLALQSGTYTILATGTGGLGRYSMTVASPTCCWKRWTRCARARSSWTPK